jgi:hypothetical protein
MVRLAARSMRMMGYRAEGGWVAETHAFCRPVLDHIERTSHCDHTGYRRCRREYKRTCIIDEILPR